MKYTKTECSVEGCILDAVKKGMCQNHYAQMWRKQRAGLECSVEGCHNKVKSRGLCYKHYKRTLKPNICKVSQCNEPVHAQELCYRHYQQVERYGWNQPY
jgi:hypothetical protein